MRKLLAALAVTALMAAVGTADDTPPPAKVDKKEPPKKAKATSLKVGDDAPALKVGKWLQGDEVKAFAPGKTYIVEFWATWCGPCIVMMPHMSELQTEYKNKGVTIIGFTSKDRNGNNEEKVTAFVKKRGPKLRYTFAYSDDRETNDAWMKAAGRGGIPCCFVVDKAGKIAYIGHPMYLDVVLPKVVAGTWKAERSQEEMEKVEKDVNGVFRALGGKDTDASLKTLTDFEKANPGLAKIPYFVGPKLNLLLRAGKENDVRKMAEEIIERAVRQEDPTALRTVSGALRTGKAKDNKQMVALSLRAANAMLKVSGEDDWQALYNLADAYFVSGDKAKAREYGRKAVTAADNPQLKKALEKIVEGYEDKKKDE